MTNTNRKDSTPTVRERSDFGFRLGARYMTSGIKSGKVRLKKMNLGSLVSTKLKNRAHGL